MFVCECSCEMPPCERQLIEPLLHNRRNGVKFMHRIHDCARRVTHLRTALLQTIVQANRLQTPHHTRSGSGESFESPEQYDLSRCEAEHTCSQDGHANREVLEGESIEALLAARQGSPA